MVYGPNCRVWQPEKSVHLDAACGARCTIHAFTWIGNNVRIGDDCKIQAFVFIPEGVEIGNRVFIGPRVTFTNDRYPPSDQWEPTFVGDDVSLGAGVVVLPGVRIGRGAMIGAGAVVTDDVMDGSTVVGVPAKPVRAYA